MWGNSGLRDIGSFEQGVREVRRKILSSFTSLASSTSGAAHYGMTLRALIHAIVESKEFRSN